MRLTRKKEQIYMVDENADKQYETDQSIPIIGSNSNLGLDLNINIKTRN